MVDTGGVVYQNLRQPLGVRGLVLPISTVVRCVTLNGEYAVDDMLDSSSCGAGNQLE